MTWERIAELPTYTKAKDDAAQHKHGEVHRPGLRASPHNEQQGRRHHRHLQHSAAQHSNALHCVAQHSIHSTAQHSAAQPAQGSCPPAQSTRITTLRLCCFWGGDGKGMSTWQPDAWPSERTRKEGNSSRGKGTGTGSVGGRTFRPKARVAAPAGPAMSAPARNMLALNSCSLWLL